MRKLSHSRRKKAVLSEIRTVITDMERIGTQAADTAEIITFLGGRTGGECEQIRFMADAASQMVTESIDAFVRQDIILAGAAIDRDDLVDDLFLQVKSSLIKLIAEKPTDGGYALDLLMIAMDKASRKAHASEKPFASKSVELSVYTSISRILASSSTHHIFIDPLLKIAYFLCSPVTEKATHSAIFTA